MLPYLVTHYLFVRVVQSQVVHSHPTAFGGSVRVWVSFLSFTDWRMTYRTRTSLSQHAYTWSPRSQEMPPRLQLTAWIDQRLVLKRRILLGWNLTAQASSGCYRCYNTIAAHRFAGGSHEWKGKEDSSDRRSEFHIRQIVVDLGIFGACGLSGAVTIIIL